MCQELVGAKCRILILHLRCSHRWLLYLIWLHSFFSLKNLSSELVYCHVDELDGLWCDSWFVFLPRCVLTTEISWKMKLTASINSDYELCWQHCSQNWNRNRIMCDCSRTVFFACCVLKLSPPCVKGNLFLFFFFNWFFLITFPPL